MRPNYKVFTIILLLILAAYATGADLSSLGYTVISEQQKGDRTVVEAQDADGNQFSVNMGASLSKEAGEIIQRSLTEFYGWSLLKIAFLRITLTDNGAIVLIVPATYIYESKDLTPYLPAGMQFYVNRAIEYDFRIMSQNLFVRLRGQLTDELRFTQRLATAIEDPAGFIERNDPEYVLRELRDVHESLVQLGLVDKDLKALVEQNKTAGMNADDAIRANLDTTATAIRGDLNTTATAIRGDLNTTNATIEKLSNEVDTLYSGAVAAFTNLKDDYMSTKAAGIEVAKDYFATKAAYLDLESRFASLTDDYAELKETLATTFETQESTDQSLQDQISLLRYAFIAEANKSFFGKIRPVENDVALRIIALKTQTPAMTAKEIVSALGDEEIKVTKKGVSFVLLTYMGIAEE